MIANLVTLGLGTQGPGYLVTLGMSTVFGPVVPPFVAEGTTAGGSAAQGNGGRKGWEKRADMWREKSPEFKPFRRKREKMMDVLLAWAYLQ